MAEQLVKQNSERTGGNGQKLKYKKFRSNIRKDFFTVRVVKRGGGVSPRSYSKPNGTESWVGAGLGDLQRCLPTSTILWFCKSSKEMLSIVNKRKHDEDFPLLFFNCNVTWREAVNKWDACCILLHSYGRRKPKPFIRQHKSHLV